MTRLKRRPYTPNREVTVVTFFMIVFVLYMTVFTVQFIRAAIRGELPKSRTRFARRMDWIAAIMWRDKNKGE